MDAHPLDNAFWSSLTTRHRDIALRVGDIARYPPAYAPFLGIAHANVDIGAAAQGEGDKTTALRALVKSFGGG